MFHECGNDAGTMAESNTQLLRATLQLTMSVCLSVYLSAGIVVSVPACLAVPFHAAEVVISLCRQLFYVTC